MPPRRHTLWSLVPAFAAVALAAYALAGAALLLGPPSFAAPRLPELAVSAAGVVAAGLSLTLAP